MPPLLIGVPRNVVNSIRRNSFCLIAERNCSISCQIHASSLIPSNVAKITEVEVVSRERIRPSFPTPPDLKTYKISLLDQLCLPLPAAFVFFYHNTQTTIPVPDVITKTSLLLKHSLAQTLTNFYPFAGKIKDRLSVDCNDEGVYYVESQVSNQMSEFLRKPDTRLTRLLLPHESSAQMDSKAGINVVMIQANFFKCGGVALAISTSHKIIDGQTYITFLKAWADTTRGFAVECPSFIPSNSLFPQNAALPEDSTLFMWPLLLNQSKFVTRRLLFNASALASLKAKASSSSFFPTRFEAVSGLIWKCAISASNSIHRTQKPSVWSLAVSFRQKIFPPVAKFVMGNLFWSGVAQSGPDAGAELQRLVRVLRDAISKIDRNFISQMQGEHGFPKVIEGLEELRKAYSDKGANYYACTSVCNGGIYEVDFGWGKPAWVSQGGAEDSLGMNLILLLDTRSGNGIEAWITLAEEDMAEFEQDPELLAFASFEQSPLEID